MTNVDATPLEYVRMYKMQGYEGESMGVYSL